MLSPPEQHRIMVTESCSTLPMGTREGRKSGFGHAPIGLKWPRQPSPGRCPAAVELSPNSDIETTDDTDGSGGEEEDLGKDFSRPAAAKHFLIRVIRGSYFRFRVKECRLGKLFFDSPLKRIRSVHGRFAPQRFGVIGSLGDRTIQYSGMPASA